ncbi:hypothetical protein Tco_1506995 [Tanacetum coccineum]
MNELAEQTARAIRQRLYETQFSSPLGAPVCFSKKKGFPSQVMIEVQARAAEWIRAEIKRSRVEGLRAGKAPRRTSGDGRSGQVLGARGSEGEWDKEVTFAMRVQHLDAAMREAQSCGSAPILALPEGKPMISSRELHACEEGEGGIWGSCVMQKKRILELGAVVFAHQDLRINLYGTKECCKTWLQLRYAIVTGKANVVADALSRKEREPPLDEPRALVRHDDREEQSCGAFRAGAEIS